MPIGRTYSSRNRKRQPGRVAFERIIIPRFRLIGLRGNADDDNLEHVKGCGVNALRVECIDEMIGCMRDRGRRQQAKDKKLYFMG